MQGSASPVLAVLVPVPAILPQSINTSLAPLLVEPALRDHRADLLNAILNAKHRRDYDVA